MALLKVLTYPDPFLKTKAKAVQVYNDALKKFLKDMAETMYVEIGIGLAATQVGSSHRMFVMDLNYNHDDPESKQTPIYVINPRILEKSGEEIMEEGCLSVPDYRAEVKRSSNLVLEYENELGETNTMQAEGLLAVCIQHEMDHLDGILFIDYLPSLKRKMIQKRLKKLASLQ